MLLTHMHEYLCAHTCQAGKCVCLRVTDMSLTKCVRAKDDIFGVRVRASFHAHDLYASVFGSLCVLFCNQ